MRLTQEEYEDIKDLAEWLGVEPDNLIHKFLQKQIADCKSIKESCWQDQCVKKKYELAFQLLLLD